MNTKSDRPSLRLTSAAPAAAPSADPAALSSALWQQSETLFGATLRARNINGSGFRIEKQRALCEELERILTEARGLADHLEANGR